MVQAQELVVVAPLTRRCRRAQQEVQRATLYRELGFQEEMAWLLEVLVRGQARV